MKKRLGFVAIASLAAGCTTTPPSSTPVPGAALSEIRYEAGPCFGACPVYGFSVRADGKGHFDGHRHTQVTGAKDFTVSAGEFATFRDALAPWKPKSGDSLIQPGNPACGLTATDMPSVEVVWVYSDGSEQRLSYYFGCDMEKYRALAEALSEAPGALPVTDYIDRR
ncbi:MAG: DUF6438 domain-containing protein [Pseudomonadota bacterium]